MLTYKKGPSIMGMIMRLKLTKEQATELKGMMDRGLVFATLDRANELLDGHGREYLYPVGNYEGVEYINKGDTYATTLMFDFAKDGFAIGSWGDLVERQPWRFA